MIESARFITCDPDCQTPVIRKNFTLADPLSGTIEVTGLGWFVLYCNGQRVSKEFFVPAVTDYVPRDTIRWTFPLSDRATHRIRFLRYDLTPYLKDGENELALRLGNGWYRQTERQAEGPTAFSDHLIAAFGAEFTERSGKTIALCSDGSEVFSPCETVYNSLYIGETIDARLAGRTQKERPVEIIETPKAILEEQTCIPDRIVRTINPVCIGKYDDKLLYDAGENISGRVCITASGEAGLEIVLRFSEELDADGRPDYHSTGSDYICASGVPQIQCDRFICSGTPYRFEPEFTWHAFRYFEINAKPEDVLIEVIHTDVPVTSSFSCDDKTLNWLFDAYIRTQLDNLHGCVPSDCPHRERLGYTGDGQITAKAAMLTLASRGVYEKWITDIFDCQSLGTGHIQHTAPLMGGGGGPGGWGCAAVIVPHEFYRHYGDLTMLSRCYNGMKHWIGYLTDHCTDGLVTGEEPNGWSLGDWATLEATAIPEPLVNSCFFVDSLRRMVEIAQLLGKPKDAEEFSMLDKTVSAAIVRKYYDPGTGSFCEGVQGADAYGLWMSLSPDPEKTLAGLVARYEKVGLFDTGFLGTEILIDVLCRHGQYDLAFDLLTAKGTGSFDNMRLHGATTLWEYMDGQASHCHPMFGAVVRHLFENFLGICQPDTSVGYRQIALCPQFPAKLTHAEGYVALPCGRITVKWHREKNAVRYTVTLPDGIHAVLRYKGREMILSSGESTQVLPVNQ